MIATRSRGGSKGFRFIARKINALIHRSGRVFPSRYHEHVLETPREVRNGLRYVLLNDRRHAAKDGRALPDALLDPCASGLAFNGWSKSVRCLIDDAPPIAKSTTWLLNIGWRRGGLIDPADIPAR